MELTHALGRRKTAVARIYLKAGNGTIRVNNREYREYFPTLLLQHKIHQPFDLTGLKDQYDVTVNVHGGGITGQAEAVRLAIARALVKINEEYKPVLRTHGLLTRDARMVERKKPGQKKARKRFQFSKR
jgi:small subunit ribosomal protein S9